LRFGAVDVLYSSSARADALASLRPSARVHVTSGSDAGKQASVGEQLTIGSDPRSGLVLSSALPQQLELRAHGGKFWVRDLGSGRAFRAGSPIGPEFSEVQRRFAAAERHGDAALRRGHVNDAEQRLRVRVEAESMACIGCNDCLLACPITQSKSVTIGELNAAIFCPPSTTGTWSTS